MRHGKTLKRAVCVLAALCLFALLAHLCLCHEDNCPVCAVIASQLACAALSAAWVSAASALKPRAADSSACPLSFIPLVRQNTLLLC